MKPNPITLAEWIASIGGRISASEALGVTPEAIHYWLERKSTPKAETIWKIMQLSNGQVGLETILRETSASFGKGSRS